MTKEAERREMDTRTEVLVKRRGKEARIENKHLPEFKALKGDLNVEWYEVVED